MHTTPGASPGARRGIARTKINRRVNFYTLKNYALTIQNTQPSHAAFMRFASSSRAISTIARCVRFSSLASFFSTSRFKSQFAFFGFKSDGCDDAEDARGRPRRRNQSVSPRSHTTRARDSHGAIERTMRASRAAYLDIAGIRR